MWYFILHEAIIKIWADCSYKVLDCKQQYWNSLWCFSLCLTRSKGLKHTTNSLSYCWGRMDQYFNFYDKFWSYDMDMAAEIQNHHSLPNVSMYLWKDYGKCVTKKRGRRKDKVKDNALRGHKNEELKLWHVIRSQN